MCAKGKGWEREELQGIDAAGRDFAERDKFDRHSADTLSHKPTPHANRQAERERKRDTKRDSAGGR